MTKAKLKYGEFFMVQSYQVHVNFFPFACFTNSINLRSVGHSPNWLDIGLCDVFNWLSHKFTVTWELNYAATTVEAFNCFCDRILSYNETMHLLSLNT